MNVGSLFSGIGGLDLGLERAGFDIAWHAESDAYCRRVLERHWPHITCYRDVWDIDELVPKVDVLAGGFPCQHISQAAARSERALGWLWPAYRHAIEMVEPNWVVIENVEALRYADRGLAEVLGDLADLGFDAEWRVIQAAWFRAPHRRARLWLVAHSYAHGEPVGTFNDEAPVLSEPLPFVSGWGAVPDLRVVDGVPDRVVRRERLGNAVVPLVAEWVGRCVLSAEARRMRAAA